jgi:hypothetical protein
LGCPALRGIADWIDFWQGKLKNRESISDIEAEGALSELDRMIKLSLQNTRRNAEGQANGYLDTFYLKRIV